MTSSEPNPHAQAVLIVKADHQTTIAASNTRVPMRSAHRAAGSANKAYESANTLNTYPIWTLSRDKSFIRTGASLEMQTRSR